MNLTWCGPAARGVRTGGLAGDVDDRAGAALNHALGEQLAHDQHASHVDRVAGILSPHQHSTRVPTRNIFIIRIRLEVCSKFVIGHRQRATTNALLCVELAVGP